MTGALLKLVGWLLLAAWRFASGELLRGYGPYDGGFLHEAPEHTGGWVGRRFKVPRTRWARMAGYRRAVWRLTPLVVLVAFALHPAITVAAVAGIAALMVWRAIRRARERSYVRNVLEPVWDALGPILGVDADADPREWLAIPRDPTDVDAVVQVGQPTWFHPTRETLLRIAEIVNDRVPGSPWVLYRESQRLVFRHADPQVHPVWAAIAPIIGEHPLLTPPEQYLTLPAAPTPVGEAVAVVAASGVDGPTTIHASSARGVRTDDTAMVRLRLPEAFHPSLEPMTRLAEIVNDRVPGGPWVLMQRAPFEAEFRPASPLHQPIWAAIAPLMGMHPLLDRAERHLILPPPIPDDEAVPEEDDAARHIRLLLPEPFRPADMDKWVRLSQTIQQRVPGGSWQECSSYGEYVGEWRPVPRPPRTVDWAEIAPTSGGSIHEIPVGRGVGGRVIVVSMESESPHWLVCAAPGQGKTSTLTLPITWACERGGLVSYVDAKKISMQALKGVPGVRFHVLMESMVWALCEFYVSMDAANNAIDAGRLHARDLPKRLLVIDEFGPFMEMATSWWKLTKHKGDPPFMHAFKQIGYQGRQSEHRMIVGTHGADSRLFGGTTIRGLFATRIVEGPQEPHTRRMALGGAARAAAELEYDEKIKGRGAIGYGQSAEEIQMGYLPMPAARARLEAAAPPPDWFTRDRHLAPWVTAVDLERARNELGIELLGSSFADGAATALADPVDDDVPAGGTDFEKTPHGSAWSPVGGQETSPHIDVSTSSPTGRPTLRLVPPDATGPATPGESAGEGEYVEGVAAAADALGVSYHAFEKARDRWKSENGGEPLPGETRRGRMAVFHRPTLLRWQADRNRAGRGPRGGQ